jgi:hypothetical protein
MDRIRDLTWPLGLFAGLLFLIPRSSAAWVRRSRLISSRLPSTVDRDKLLLTDDAPLFWYCTGKDMPVMHLDGIKSLIW